MQQACGDARLLPLSSWRPGTVAWVARPRPALLRRSSSTKLRFQPEDVEEREAPARSPSPMVTTPFKVIGLGQRGITCVNKLSGSDYLGSARFWAIDADKKVLSSAADSVQRLEVYAGDSSTQTIDFEQLTEEESRRDDAGPRMDGEAGAVFLIGAAHGSPGGPTLMLQLVNHLKRQGHFVAVTLTRPFLFEGTRKLEQADALIEMMEETAHLVVVVDPSVLKGNITMAQASTIADTSVQDTVRSIAWALSAHEMLTVASGSLAWYGRDLRQMRRPLAPPMLTFLTCPGHAHLGRGRCWTHPDTMQGTPLVHTLTDLSTEVVQEAARSAFVQDRLHSATALLCVLVIPRDMMVMSGAAAGGVGSWRGSVSGQGVGGYGSVAGVGVGGEGDRRGSPGTSVSYVSHGNPGAYLDNAQEYALRSALQAVAHLLQDLTGPQCRDIVICPHIVEDAGDLRATADTTTTTAQPQPASRSQPQPQPAAGSLAVECSILAMNGTREQLAVLESASPSLATATTSASSAPDRGSSNSNSMTTMPTKGLLGARPTGGSEQGSITRRVTGGRSSAGAPPPEVAAAAAPPPARSGLGAWVPRRTRVSSSPVPSGFTRAGIPAANPAPRAASVPAGQDTGTVQGGSPPRLTERISRSPLLDAVWGRRRTTRQDGSPVPNPAPTQQPAQQPPPQPSQPAAQPSQPAVQLTWQAMSMLAGGSAVAAAGASAASAAAQAAPPPPRVSRRSQGSPPPRLGSATAAAARPPTPTATPSSIPTPTSPPNNPPRQTTTYDSRPLGSRFLPPSINALVSNPQANDDNTNRSGTSPGRLERQPTPGSLLGSRATPGRSRVSWGVSAGSDDVPPLRSPPRRLTQSQSLGAANVQRGAMQQATSSGQVPALPPESLDLPPNAVRWRNQIRQASLDEAEGLTNGTGPGSAWAREGPEGARGNASFVSLLLGQGGKVTPGEDDLQPEEIDLKARVKDMLAKEREF